MARTEDELDLVGVTVYGRDVVALGVIAATHVPEQLDAGSFATVRLRQPPSRCVQVCLNDAVRNGDSIFVPYEADVVRAAPSPDVDLARLGPAELQRLRAHYGVGSRRSASRRPPRTKRWYE